MKILHIEGVSRESYVLPAKAMEKLPKKGKIGLCTTIQFIKSIPAIKKQLEKAGDEVVLLQGRHSAKKGQILGCDVPKIEGASSVLFVGDGLFHPKALFLKNNLPVYAYNPYSKKLSRINEEDVKDFERFRKIALAKFHASDNIGIITSIKPGQRVSGKELKKIEEKYKDKKFYKFSSDTINFQNLGNFPFIGCWVNSACPRIAYDEARNIGKAMINWGDLG